MADGLFQTTHAPGSGLFDGEIEAKVYEDDPLMPTHIISTDSDWHIEVEWEVSGIEVPMVGGTWHLKAHLERIGPGADMTKSVPAIALDQGTNYSEDIAFTAGEVPAGEYDCVVVLTYKDLTAGPGPLAGNVKLPMLQFYVP